MFKINFIIITSYCPTCCFIFSLTLFPTVQPQPKNLPIAIVNEDQGVEIPNQPKMNMGQTIVDNMKKTSKSEEEPAVKWIEVKNEKPCKTV